MLQDFILHCEMSPKRWQVEDSRFQQVPEVAAAMGRSSGNLAGSVLNSKRQMQPSVTMEDPNRVALGANQAIKTSPMNSSCKKLKTKATSYVGFGFKNMVFWSFGLGQGPGEEELGRYPTP
ncbi:hypothetical protein U0070_025660 [Myodes glareolus]|uniref:Uncharacterized protein n=1 Tax=Myodes glareolus TaxID=447135 RepID=A0AAW0I4E2_MYOGA